MKLDLYVVDSKYIQHLQQAEIEARGFTRVPNMDYPDGKQKLSVGAVLEICGLKYYVGLTSYKIQKSENMLIKIKAKNPIVGSLRFNYMFPVPDCALRLKKIKDEQDVKYKNLLLNEYDFIKNNEKAIIQKAQEVYELVTKKTGSQTLLLNSCDFKVLEQAAKTYSG